MTNRDLTSMAASLAPLPVALALAGLLVSMQAPADVGTEAGTIQGKLVFRGSKGEALSRTPRGVVAADAVIYLVGEGLAPKSGAAPGSDTGAAKPVLDQVDIAFVPHVLPVVAGVTVEVRNSDATTHNVHTYPRKNAAMNKTQAPEGKFEVAYDKPEVIHVGCDIHSQMSAYIVVVPNEHFTMSKKDGSFTLTGVPPGDYELVTWHEKYDQVSQKITVAPGAATDVEVTLKAKPRGGRRRAKN